jgi:hypothetical protein
LRELKEQFGQERLDELAEFLRDYVTQRLTGDDPDTQDLAQAQDWTALAYTKPDEAASELAKALSEKVKQENMSEVLRLTSLIETFAEPLIEFGFEPLLTYASAMNSFARGDLEKAGNKIVNLPKQGRLVGISGLILPIPAQILMEKDEEEEQVAVSLDSQLHLIQSLLAVPSGKESEFLQANQDLINVNLLLTMKQVATIMADEGNENAANWLRNLAAQLAEVVVESTPYREFLLQVLQVTNDSNGDSASLYPLLAANVDKLDENFANILQTWATSTLPDVDAEQAQSIAITIANFSNSIAQFPLGSRAKNIEIAVTGYEIGLTVFQIETYPEQWATTQNNLGTAYLDRIVGDKAQNLERAIAAYTAALQVYTRDAFPQNWARKIIWGMPT